jgi:hypothetical protein
MYGALLPRLDPLCRLGRDLSVSIWRLDHARLPPTSGSAGQTGLSVSRRLSGCLVVEEPARHGWRVTIARPVGLSGRALGAVAW